MMKLIVGLGNPGSRYEHTRHNAGRLAVERLASEEGVRFSKETSLASSVALVSLPDQEIVIAYPEVFMNESGIAVKKLVEHFVIQAAQDLLVVVDDAALPWSRLRMRGSGSDGGHNGLKSVEAYLQTHVYARLRMGIGHGELGGPVPGTALEAFVLEPFSKDESRSLPAVLEKAAQGCRLWALKPLSEAMNAVNPYSTET